MNDLIIKQTHALIQAGEIAEAEANLAVIAEQEGDHALVEVLDEMAPKDVLAVMREFDTSKESIINLVVSPEQFVQAIVLERQYGEPLERYVPRLRNTMNAVMHRNPGACAEALECLAEHDEGGVAHPLVWARELGPSRVIVDLLGHDTASYDSPEHRELLRRAIEWLAGDRPFD